MKKNVFDKIDDGIMKFELYVCYIMFAVMISIIFLNAIFRVFGGAINFAPDLAQLMFVWVSVLGADMALKKSRHVGVDLLIRKLPKKAGKCIMIVIYLGCLLFLVIAAYYGVRLAVQNRLRTFNTLKMSYAWITSAVPAGFLLMTYTIVRQIYFMAFDKEDYYADKLEDIEEVRL